MNETHSFGKKCHDSNQETCLAVHIRSGDVFRGSYDENRHWVSEKVHHLYQEPPLDYYMHAIKWFRQRHQNSTRYSIIIACENDNNPVCEIFRLLSETDEDLKMIYADLLSTLQTVTCCEELVLSFSTLSLVLKLSPRIRHVSSYGNCLSRLFNYGFIPFPTQYYESTFLAVGFNISSWNNSEFERYNMLKPYEVVRNECPRSAAAKRSMPTTDELGDLING